MDGFYFHCVIILEILKRITIIVQLANNLESNIWRVKNLLNYFTEFLSSKYAIIIIVIIKSGWQHGTLSPFLSVFLAIRSCLLLLLAGFLDYIQFSNLIYISPCWLTKLFSACVCVHKRIAILLLFPAYYVHSICMNSEMGSKWPYRFYFVNSFFQDNT